MGSFQTLSLVTFIRWYFEVLKTSWKNGEEWHASHMLKMYPYLFKHVPLLTGLFIKMNMEKKLVFLTDQGSYN